MASLPDAAAGAAPEADPATISRARLALLVLEGYAYLAVIIGIFVAAVAFLAWGLLKLRPFISLLAIFVGVPLVVTTGRAIRALFVTFPDAKRLVVTPEPGAPLHAAVEEIRRRLGAPRVHRLLVTGAFNASVLQIPRAGIFWTRNTLLLGFPLLATLSPDQMRAVIAHELGHMAHAHGRFSAWVYRTRLSWMRLMDSLNERGATPAHAHLLFRWYVPRLRVQSAAVSRRHELLADRIASELTGPRHTAQALVAIEIGGYVLDQTFWPSIFNRAQHDAHPPRPFSEMGPGLWTAFAARAELLDHLLQAETEPTDTHPSLRNRLARLGQPPQLPDVAAPTAADEFLAHQRDQIAAALDEQWQAECLADWRQRHDDARENRDRLARLAAMETPPPAAAYDRAELTERSGDRQGALDLYLSAHRAGHAGAGLAAGRLLLEREDESGLGLIEAAMDADPELTDEGCPLVVEFLERRRRLAEAHRFRVRHRRRATQVKMAGVERSQLTVIDRFVPCRDPEVDTPSVARRLSAEPDVLRAYLVTKELRYSTGTQTVLAILTKGPGASNLREQLQREGLLPQHATVASLTRHPPNHKRPTTNDQRLTTNYQRLLENPSLGHRPRIQEPVQLPRR